MYSDKLSNAVGLVTNPTRQLPDGWDNRDYQHGVVCGFSSTSKKSRAAIPKLRDDDPAPALGLFDQMDRTLQSHLAAFEPHEVGSRSQFVASDYHLMPAG